ncbi:MAG: 30S ribosomal protein S4 [Nitrososphaerota archaeon]
MGDPHYPSRVWKKPKRPLNYDFMMEDLNTLGTYGLKNKRELWKARTELSRVRHQARSLLALRQEVREQKEPILMKSLARIGLVKEDATLDDVLNLDINNLLSRRLQTIVQKKFSFKTPYQARQAIVHGHITIGDRVISIPSYIVNVNEEPGIQLSPKFKVQSAAPPAPEAPQEEAAPAPQS